MAVQLLAIALMLAPPPGDGITRGVAAGEIRLLCFGDSITYGQGLEDPDLDSFAALTRASLAARVPGASVTAEVVAYPGATAGSARAYLANRALAARPNLTIVQFGGNDSAATATTSLGRFREDLAEVVGQLRETGSDVIVLIQPFNMKERAEREAQFMNIMREVAAEHGAAVAEGHRRMSDEPHDRRGWFPFAGWGHPNWYGHRLMAEEIWGALLTLWPEAGRLRIAVEPAADITEWPTEPSLSLGLAGGDAGPVSVDVWVDGELVRNAQARLDAAGTGSVRIPLPLTGAMGTRRLWVTGRGAGTFGATVGRLGVRQLLVLPTDGTIGEKHLASGRVAWTGEADCSGAFTIGLEDQALVVEVLVRDDAVHPGEGWAPDGDCVEVALDLNPPERAAMPYFTERSTVAFIAAPTEDTEPRVSFMDADLALADVTATGAVTDDGYRVRLLIPRASLALPEGQSSIGLDIAIDDSDGVTWRQSQLVWSGGWDMALTAEPCARVDLTGQVGPDWRWVTVR